MSHQHFSLFNLIGTSYNIPQPRLICNITLLLLHIALCSLEQELYEVYVLALESNQS